MLRHRTLNSSRGVKGVSGLWSSSGGEFGLFQTDSQGCQALPSCCEGIFTVPLEPVQGDQDLSGAECELDILFPCSRIRGVPLEIQLVTQASTSGASGSWDSILVEAGNGPSSLDEVGHTGLFSSCGGNFGFHLEL